MTKLVVTKILKEKNLTKYWLYKQMGMSYQNLNRMLNNETSSIRYSTIDALCSILECEPGDLFEYNSDVE